MSATGSTRPAVSVIIPAYNAAALISDTLDSVLAQTHPPHEIVVVDDGSTDGTETALEPYREHVRIFHQDNAGVARARNFGIEQATGDWLAFVDADDLWRPDKLESQIESLGGQRWSHTNSLYFGHNQDGSTSRAELAPQFGGDVFDKLIVSNFITTSTVLMERRLFLDHGGFDETMRALEDWKLWIEIAAHEDLHYEPECLTRYRILPGSASRRARSVLPYHLEVIDSVFSGLPHGDRRRRLRKKALAESFQTCSYIAEDAEDFAYSAYCAWRSAVNDKANPSRWRRLARATLNTLRAPAASA